MSSILSSPMLGLLLCLCGYALGTSIATRISHPLVNPLVIASVFCITIMQVLGIPYEVFAVGGNILSTLIGPATIVLAVGVYQRRLLLAKYMIPILTGCTVGAGVSIASVLVLSHLVGLDETVTASLLPKSVTNAIAIELSPLGGGIASITVFSVIVTGIFTVVAGPPIARLLHLDDPLSMGIALGTSAHLIGTSTAITLGETEGAMASIAICFTGLATAGILLFL